MNRHAEKLVHAPPDDPVFDPALGGFVEDVYRCPACGAGASRPAPHRLRP
jgi:hypothetical protein